RAGEAKNCCDFLAEIRPAVIAAALYILKRARVERDRFVPWKQLVAGAHEQKITVGPRDSPNSKRAQFGKVRCCHFERFSGMEIRLRPAVRAKVFHGPERRIDRCGGRSESFREVCRIDPTERAADQRQLRGSARSELVLDPVGDITHRCGRIRRQRWDVEARAYRAGHRFDGAHEALRLDALWRRAKTVQVDKVGQRAPPCCRNARSSASSKFLAYTSIADAASRGTAARMRSDSPRRRAESCASATAIAT